MSELARTDVKVGIATPIYESIHATTHANHMQICLNWSNLLCKIIPLHVNGHGTADARNALVEASLEQKCTHTFFMDDDCTIPIHTLPRLLAYKDLDVMSGVICSTVPMFEQKGGIWNNNEYSTIKLPLDGKVYEVDWCPLGCCLIDNKWFYEVGRPYFLDSSHELGRMRIRQNKNHNINFMETVKKLGAKVCIDTGILVAHGKGAVKIAPNPETSMGRVEIR